MLIPVSSLQQAGLLLFQNMGYAQPPPNALLVAAKDSARQLGMALRLHGRLSAACVLRTTQRRFNYKVVTFRSFKWDSWDEALEEPERAAAMLERAVTPARLASLAPQQGTPGSPATDTRGAGPVQRRPSQAEASGGRRA